MQLNRSIFFAATVTVAATAGAALARTDTENSPAAQTATSSDLYYPKVESLKKYPNPPPPNITNFHGK